MIGETILHYKIIEKLGEGGMGEVYKAQDTKLDRFVALKFLPSQLTASEEDKKRFIQEARAASAMNHPNVCTIYDIQENEGQLFIVMEFVDGKTLKDKKDTLSEKQILEIGIQTAEGLAAAHEKGIVHRDIKPENLMIRKDGIAQIMDFGLAKLYKEGNVSRLTKAGTTVGTMGYMSPEQVQGLDVDHRTDIFSLGVVLYELLAGEPPFKGVHETAIMYEIVNVDPPPISTVKEGIDPQLDYIILECLEKDKDDRCQSAKELAKDLKKVKKSTGNRKSRVYNVNTYGIKTATTQSQISKSSGAFSVEVFNHRFDLGKLFRLKYLPWALLALTLVFVIYSQIYNSKPGINTFNKFERLTEQSGEELYPDISPDGNYITYTKSVDGFQHIFLQRIGGGNAIDLTNDSKFDNYQSSFSPNGEEIVFRSERDGGGIFLMGSTGESVKRLTNFGYNPAWSPDGTKIIFATESVEHPYTRGTISQLWTAQIKTGETKKIFNGDAVQPSWSPNGNLIAYWGLPKGSGRRVIQIIQASGGDPIELTNDNYINWSPTWSADGKYLYFSSSRGGSMNLWRVKIDEGSGKTLSSFEPVTTPSAYCAMAKMSHDNKKMIFVSSDIRDNINMLNFDPSTEKVNGGPIAVTKGSKQFGYPDVSPDNKWLSVSSLRQQEGIYIMRSDGSDISKLTNDLFKDRGPQWSPDGRSLIFYSDRSGKYETWNIDIDGSNLRQLTNSVGQVSNPIWFPDGKSIVTWINDREVIFYLGSTPVNKFTNLSDLNEKGFVFYANSVSPNGNYIAGNRENDNNGNNEGMLVYSMIRKNYKIISGSGTNPLWLKDNKSILYLDNNKFYVINSETGVIHFVYDPKTFFPTFNCTALSPDNKSIYYVKEEKESDIWMGFLK
jgi:eukaryotic-like serine/threonine-protein kinase